MAIPFATRWQIAEGKQTDFSKRVAVRLHREAIYRMHDANPVATGQDLLACRACWATTAPYEYSLTLAILNEQFVNVEDVDALAALPDDGPGSVGAAVSAQWDMFVSVFFPS